MFVPVIYNNFFTSPVYRESVELYVRGLKSCGFDSYLIPSCDLLNKDNYDFSCCVFLDKDISLAQWLENKGVKVFNSSDAIRICDSKILTYINLKDKNIPMPETTVLPFKFSNLSYDNFDFLNNINSFPLVLKEEFGSQGQQVSLIYNKEEIISKLNSSSQRFLLQEYIECDGRDIRIFVCDGKAICAMERHNSKDFRSNCGVGGQGKEINLDFQMAEIAENAAKILGLDFAGVDLINKDGDYYLIEVNSNPLINNLEKACDISVGFEIGKIIKDRV